MTYSQLLWDIFSAIAANLPLILFSIIGIIFASKGKSPTVWFIIPLIFHLVSYYGQVIGNFFSPLSFCFTLIYFFSVFSIAKKKQKKIIELKQKNDALIKETTQNIINELNTTKIPETKECGNKAIHNLKESHDAVALIESEKYKRNKENVVTHKKIKVEIVSPKYCRFCGAKVEKGFLFCNQCGKPI